MEIERHASRGDDALIDRLAEQGMAYAPFFPLVGFSSIQSRRLPQQQNAL